MKQVIIIAFTCLLLCTPLAALGEKPTVLIIASYHNQYLWQADYHAGIVEKLGADYQVDLFEMDTKRLPKSEYKKRAQLAWEHYENVKPQLVFLGDDNALRYLAPKFVETETPVVYLGINNNPKKYGASDQKNITGVLERPLYKQSVKMLQGLLNKKPRKVLFLFDDGVTTRAVVSMTFKNKTKLRIHGVPVQVKRVGTLKRWQETVLRAKDDGFDAIVTGGYNTIKDDEGNHVPIAQVGQWTNTHTPVPMFSFWSFSVAADQTIGGLVLFGKSQGEKAGELALRILKEGVSPGEIRPAVSEKGRYFFSQTQLKKWGLTLPEAIASKAEYVD
ncbi:MAG: hypothetical protein ETSY1_08865 [Candidatus Entotheonella factor]|uniref:Sugar ABC transporter substrate-binding protein n=1 Tax=Entotheonella factor TaxID=1429438 RepID=W4LT73_ENTF1|nr:ABC transporter substrate binding protein [Candidatus Entotheonella palauensis]ETX01065.1 MAG: hypothetical protein ETSY1_08865 [Candidatus Entotheonella factor]